MIFHVVLLFVVIFINSLLHFFSKVLLRAASTKRFRLIVVDTRPLNEGLKTLAALSPHVRCVHTPLTGAAVTMREATRVILGASALLSNGSMLAPAGTAMVASLAKVSADTV